MVLSGIFAVYLLISIPNVVFKQTKMEFLQEIDSARDLEEVKALAKWNVGLLATSLAIAGLHLKRALVFAGFMMVLFSVALYMLRGHRDRPQAS